MLENIAKSNAMLCQPGTFRFRILEEAVGRQFTVRGTVYKKWLRRQIPCPDWGVELILGTMMSHRQWMHVTDP